MNAGQRAWLGVAAVLAGGSVVAWWLPAPLLDWQPALAGSEPWRAVTAAFVHWSTLHLAANLGAAAAVAGFGAAAGVPRGAAIAWAAAWPLTQVGLLVQPLLLHYGGLSGVLHAGVAVACLWLLVQGRGRRRAIGAMVMTGMFIKLTLEQPWGPPLREGGGFDIATAPLAHATGAVAGLACAALALVFDARRSGRRP